MKQSHLFSILHIFCFGAKFHVGKIIAEMESEVFISRLLRNYKVEGAQAFKSKLEWSNSTIQIYKHVEKLASKTFLFLLTTSFELRIGNKTIVVFIHRSHAVVD